MAKRKGANEMQAYELAENDTQLDTLYALLGLLQDMAISKADYNAIVDAVDRCCVAYHG